MKRIGVLTSGGDAPGMNAAVRAVALVGRALGIDVVGIERGYRGLLDAAFVPLLPVDVAGILREGGTILGSARCKEFHQRDVRDRARAILAERGVDGLVVIGGNGSLTGALRLADPAELGGQTLQIVGVPASIDNDLGLTSRAIGVDTALNTIVEACDKIADTATAHDRAFIVEVMGRDCGYLAMTAAIAVGADLALFPESNKTVPDIVDRIVKAVAAARTNKQRGRRVLIIKAEGVHISVDQLKAKVDAELRLRGDATAGPQDERSESVPTGTRAKPMPIETRVTVLGHVVRGGRPSAFDRLLASRLANVATRALVAGTSHKMVAWMPPSELPAEIGARSPHDPYCWLVDLAAALAETDNLLAGNSPLARWRAGAFDEIEAAMLL